MWEEERDNITPGHCPLVCRRPLQVPPLNRFERERRRDAFQRHALGIDPQAPRTAAAISMSAAPSASPRTPPCARRCRSARRTATAPHAAGGGAERKEDCDRERPQLERKDFARCEIGRARRRRSEEENDAPHRGLSRRRQVIAARTAQPVTSSSDPIRVGRRDHTRRPTRIEQVPEQRAARESCRSQTAADRGRCAQRHVIEARKHQRIGKEDRVVEKRLRGDQHEAQQPSGARYCLNMISNTCRAPCACAGGSRSIALRAGEPRAVLALDARFDLGDGPLGTRADSRGSRASAGFPE